VDLGPKLCCTLRTLHITDAVVFIGHVGLLLKVCPQLNLFSMSWDGECDVYRKSEWQAQATVLTHFNPVLEELRIDIAHEVNVRGIISGASYNFCDLPQAEQDMFRNVNSYDLGSLDGLEHLRKLSAPSIALFGVFDDPEERDHDWTLAELLSSGLEEHDIFCEGVDFKEEDIALLDAPGTGGLHRFAIWNCTRDKCISRNRS
jgi:hypothetical protein